ncbi:hemolymph clottable protein-like [Panulirus ornatus]|uniref:hemolymph clottable protein-like n=1 Tax=Panulirus ornatus TaxID=150431 RepID=UPI003A83CC81
MMVVVLLLALVGSCWGLQPKLEYQYRYYGRVASGIPSVKNQFSGAGIQADVTVQLTEVPVILVQISNVQVGDMHDELKCDLRNPLPIEYHRLVEGVELLETPFVVHLNDTEEADYMEAPVEPTWITNIRRSIVNIFRVAPLRVNFGIRGQEYQSPTFGVTETTMSGHCFNWYSLLRLPEEEAAQKNKEQEAQIEDDIQRDQQADSYTDGSKTGGSKSGRKSVAKGKTSHGKTSQTSEPGRLLDIPAINDGLWTMVRTVDFNLCEDLVALKLHGHKKTDEKISRSSVGTYLLRGDETGWRIERAVVEGSVSVFADAAKENHVDTFTNQTLELRAVRILREQLPIDYEPHHDHSWQYGVVHRLPDTLEDVETHPSLEQVVTGVTLTEDMVTQAKTYIIEHLEATATHLTTTPHPTTPISEKIGKIADALGLLSRQEINVMLSLIPLEDPHYEQKTIILNQAMLAAGTGPTIDYLLEQMRDELVRSQSFRTILKLLRDPQPVLKNPLVLPKLVELVLNLPWDGVDQFIKPVGLMSVAKLANKFCLNAGRRETFGSNTCDPHHVCNADQIIEVLLPALIQGVQAEEEPVWKRVVYLQALANLGAPQSIATLKHIILGETESHSGLRLNAIMSLSPTYMPKTVYHTVFNLLMPIFDNLAEHHEIRNAAFLVMSMWEPRITWWQRVATSTWHEPSSQVASFVSTAITSLARGKESVSISASRTVHLVKPASSHSIAHSSLIYLHEYLYNCELESKATFAWLASTKSLFPSSVLLHVQLYTITGLPVEGSLFLHQRILEDIVRITKTALGKPDDVKRSDAFDIVNEMFEQVKEQLGMQPPTKEPELSLWLRMQHVYLVTRAGVFDDQRTAFLPDASLLYVDPTVANMPSFWRDVDSTIALPTDVGLPILIKYAEQSAILLQVVNNNPGAASGITKIKASFSCTYDVSFDSILEARTLLPWSQNFAVGAGAHYMFSMLLPLHLHGSVDVAHKSTAIYRRTPCYRDGRTQQATLPTHCEGAGPSEQHLEIYRIGDEFYMWMNRVFQVEILRSHNHPYTLLAGPFPTAINPDQLHHDHYKPILVADTELYSRHTRPLPAVVGLDVETIWSGDIKFPHLFDPRSRAAVLAFHPSYKTWDYRIVFHPESSATKSITITMAYETLERSASIVQEQNVEELGQETQGPASFPDYSQLSQSSQDIQQGFDEVDTFQVEQTSQSRAIISKLQQEFLPASGGSVQTVSVGVELHGEPTRSYETVLTWIIGTIPAHDDEQAQSFAKLQLTLLENVPEGFLGQPQVTCVKLQVQRPGFLPLASLQDVLGTNFQTLINGDVYTGYSCEETPILTIKGSTSVSEEGLGYVRDHITPEGPGCDGEPVLQALDVITRPIYDRAHLNITWTEDFSESIVNLTYYADDLLHCALFSHASVDHTARHPGHLVDIDATKNPTTNHWTVRTTRPQEVSVIHDLVIPPPLEPFFSPAGVTLTDPKEFPVCVIEANRVRTFDGVVMPFEPSNCWVTANSYITDQSQGIDSCEGVLQVSFTGEWMVRLLWPARGLLMDMTSSQLLVNGEDFNGVDDDFQFHHLPDSTLLTFSTGYAIKVSDKVEIMDTLALKSKVQGLCGNMDGETSAEMVGPLGCLYTDPALYALAWTTPGDACNSFTLKKARGKVEDFQETCYKRTFVSTGLSHPKALYDCTEWTYQERTYDNYVCKALVPTPVCKPGCKEMNPITEPIEYDCEVLVHYHQGAAVPKKCYSHTLSTTYPSTCVPSYG